MTIVEVFIYDLPYTVSLIILPMDEAIRVTDDTKAGICYDTGLINVYTKAHLCNSNNDMSHGIPHLIYLIKRTLLLVVYH